MKLAHVSDIHFGCEHKDAVAACSEWIAGAGVDLVVVSGDITRAGDRAEFAAARAWLDAMAAPKLITPGNHDVPYYSLPHRLLAPWNRYRDTFGAPRAARHYAPGLAVAAFNSARGAQPRANWSKGQVWPSQIREAAAAVAEGGPQALRVVVCHHPLMELVGGPMTGRVWGGRTAAQGLAQASADLVLTGHVHAPFALPYPFGDGRTYAVGASTLSVRERGVPIGFNCIEADERTVTVTAFGWAGSHFEAWRTWSLDRRVRP